MSLRLLHDVYRVTLRIDELVHIESDWIFRIYSDGTLTVEIQRPANWREQLHADADVDLERLERELAYSYVSYDGHATQMLPDAGLKTTGARSPQLYTCTFDLAKCGPEGESWTVEFEATLSPLTGFQGHWRHEAMQEYALWQSRFEEEDVPHIIPHATLWGAAVEPVKATLAPLTVGSYTLQGSLMDDENYGFIVPLSMEIELLADGSLTGVSTNAWSLTHDGGEAETATLSGTWTRNSVDMVQAFEFANAPNEVFAFHGHVSTYGIAGEWAVVELEALGDWEDSDRQRFRLRVTTMQRPWTPQAHASFSATFHAPVRCCLLSSVHMTSGDSSFRLPSVLWPRVLSFCDSEWFYNDDCENKR